MMNVQWHFLKIELIKSWPNWYKLMLKYKIYKMMILKKYMNKLKKQKKHYNIKLNNLQDNQI